MASLIKGITVILYERIQTGADDFNQPVYKEIPYRVSNVLVTPVAATPIVGENQLNGKRLEYELCIPKENTNVWEDRTVEFFGRKWHTIGFPEEWIGDNLPLDWNKKVRVECYG